MIAFRLGSARFRQSMTARHVLCVIYAIITILLLILWFLFLEDIQDLSSFAPTYGQAKEMSYEHSDEYLRQQGKPPTEKPYSDFGQRFMNNQNKTIDKRLNILMLIVVQKGTDLKTYSNALGSMKCYAQKQGYHFKVIEDAEYPMCQQKDFMFRRHCVVLQFLPNYDYIVFLDGDMAVVNPKRRFEEYIDPTADITFYERIDNWEFAAGSYLAKNCEWTKEFLKLFADYEQQIPKSFHGTDNGALHIFIAELMYPDLHEDLKTCWSVYRQSKNYDTLFTYEACVRNVMGFRRKIENIKIMEKGTSWVRDIWLTDSRWCLEKDFMLHALQQQRRIGFQEKILDRANMGARHLYYYDPFEKNVDWTKCEKEDFKWPLDERLIVPASTITEIIEKIKREREKKRWKFSGYVEKFIKA
ncbi:unnamed protein product, partial [Mesorhabditis belari]|uniref:Uncharacterized protein n=1 Tax=Mesorhabditis belari TaxID=2138241 RepID=A0AAF3F1M5_9BILA